MSGITPFLWFDDKAEEAMNLYVSLFPNSHVINVSRMGPSDGESLAPAFSVTFEINGQRFQGMNGGPHYTFTPAVSFMVDCETQEEIDRYWNALSDGGHEMQCGWVTDRFGVTWQIIPSCLGTLLGDADQMKAGRARDAMMSMIKFDIAALKRAHAGGSSD